MIHCLFEGLLGCPHRCPRNPHSSASSVMVFKSLVIDLNGWAVGRQRVSDHRVFLRILYFSPLPTVFLTTYTSLAHTPAHISTASQLPPPSISSILTCVTLHLLPWWSLRSMRLWCWCRLPARVITSPGIRDYFYLWHWNTKQAAPEYLWVLQRALPARKRAFPVRTCARQRATRQPDSSRTRILRLCDSHALLHIRCN